MALPPVPSISGLEQWRQQLKLSAPIPSTPKIPWNFTVVTKQGGNYLTWQTVNGADGYIVDVSLNGDFSTGVTSVTLMGNANTAYFDSVPTAKGLPPPIRYYRVRATAGTSTNPQSVEGLNTSVLSAHAIAPNDTVTNSVSVTDSGTSDSSQTQAGRGNYHRLAIS
jgi:hypothetical protein